MPVLSAGVFSISVVLSHDFSVTSNLCVYEENLEVIV
jgi:hypothetical protein